MEFPVRSGIVDGVYTVVFEILLFRALFCIVRGITRKLGTRRVNEHGRLRLISTKWTNMLGHATTPTGHLLRIVLSSLFTVSLFLITYGTTGFTKIEVTEKEVLYVSQTDDVDAQYESALSALMGRNASWDFTSRLNKCVSEDAGGVHVYSAFCETKLCMDSVHTINEVQQEPEYGEMLQHLSENGRCNDGLDAPEIQLSPNLEMASDNRKLPKIEYRGGQAFALSWQLLESDEIKLFMAVPRKGQQIAEGENPQYFVCVKAYYEDYYLFTYTMLEILEDDLVKVTIPGAPVRSELPDGETWKYDEEELGYFSMQRQFDLDRFSFDSFTLRVKNSNVLVSNVEKWMTIGTVVSLMDELRGNTWQGITMVSWRVVSGTQQTEFVPTQATKISAVSIGGLILLAATSISLLLMLIVCLVQARIRSYEPINLALTDHEIYGLMKNRAIMLDDGNSAKASHLELGFPTKDKHWGVLCGNS